MKYPKDRRSPTKHTVSGHIRQGHRVKSYTRGSGSSRSRNPQYRRVKHVADDDTKIGMHAFTCNFKYSDRPGDGESVIVFADNYADASDEAFEEKIDPRAPISVEIIDPDIGAVLKWTGQRVRSAIKYGKPRIVKATKLGAKYTVRATMATGRTTKRVAKAGIGGGKELLRLTAFVAQKAIIQSMLKACYQRDKVKRIAARVALKKRFPDIYHMCDFSKETRKRPRKIKVPKVTYLPKGYRVVKM